MMAKSCGNVTHKLHNDGHPHNRSKIIENCTNNMITKFCRKATQKLQFMDVGKTAVKLMKTAHCLGYQESAEKQSETAEI